MIIATIICTTIIICALIFALPTIQSQYYEHLEKQTKLDYELAEEQIKLEKEKLKYQNRVY